jgi:hypothetical protein
MTWPVIVKQGPALNQTLATIKFDQFGTSTNQEIFVCDSWVNGFNWAKSCGHTHALFVDSGTIVRDWILFRSLIDQYPHSGLVAHLIWKSNDTLPHLNDQCWFMNINQFDHTDFETAAVVHPSPVRSVQNLHNDYTPLWIKPGKETVQYNTTEFGQGLIAHQLANNKFVVNWNNTARDLKFYMYNEKLDLSEFQDYKNIAEKQLWVFNNEPVVVVKQSRLVTPGSGLSWMLNIIDPATIELQIVDISQTQVKFCQCLWDYWDGTDYGTFVWEFIQNNKLIHFELDNPKITPLERLQLKGKTKFINYVNSTFANLTPADFTIQWQDAQHNKQVGFCNNNLIHWVLENDTTKYDHIWCSNILDYKWTLLHTTAEQYKQFQSKIK